jgi:hypothetical protein
MQPLEALAHCGAPTSFTRWCGGPGTPWPCQARGCGRNIENFGDGQRLPKLRAGCSSHAGGTTYFKNLRLGVVFAGGLWLRLVCSQLPSGLLDCIRECLDVVSAGSRNEMSVQVHRDLDHSCLMLAEALSP